MSMWEEVKRAKEENRRELVITGKILQERFKKENRIDPELFELCILNFLHLGNLGNGLQFCKFPEGVAKLRELTTLILSNVGIAGEVPASPLLCLTKLKVLNLSGNAITSFPDGLALEDLWSLNLANNQLTGFPSLEKFKKLAHVDLSNNQIDSLDFMCSIALEHLADVHLAHNKIQMISPDIKVLHLLKTLDLSDNFVKTVPVELGDCLKLKDLNLKGNPLIDNRLKKMVTQKGTKPVLDYIRQHCQSGYSGDMSQGRALDKKKGVKSKKDKKKQVATEEKEEMVKELTDVLQVMNVNKPDFEILADDSVKDIRPFIVCCIVRNIDLFGTNLKRFIQLQTKLHDSICGKRFVGTIATHDLAKIAPGTIRYCAKYPKELKIVPLHQVKEADAETLVEKLKKEAEAYRKEKKRNTISGVHQYLKLLDGHDQYCCLEDASGKIISFPPITNSEVTKISDTTRDILIEVTSSVKLQTAKSIADELLKEMLFLELGFKKDKQVSSESSSDSSASEAEEVKKNVLIVEQVKVLDSSHNLKVVYPSNVDLDFQGRIEVKRCS